MFRKAIALFVLMGALAACDVSSMVPAEDMNFAKRVVAMIKTQDGAGLQAVCDPALWAQLPDGTRAQMAAIFPNETEASVTVSSWHTNFNNGVSDTKMEMLYKYAHQDVKVTIGFKSAGQHHTLMMIYVLPMVNGQPSPIPPAPSSSTPMDNGSSGTSMPAPDMGQPQDDQQQPDQQTDDKQQSL